MVRVPRWHRRHLVLALSVLAYFSIRFVEFVLSIVFEDLKATLGISTFVVGLAVAASTVTYAAVQLPSGVLGDRFGHRRVVLASVGLTGAASLLLAAAPSGLALVLGMAVLGLVGGAYYSPATVLLTRWFDGTGQAIGVHRVGAQVVGLTGPVVAVLVATYTWRVPLVLAAVVTVPAFLGFLVLVAPRSGASPRSGSRDRITASGAWDLLSRPPVAVTTAVAGLAQFADTATFSFLPLLLREYHGLSIEVAGTLFTLYFVAVAVSQPATGRLSDRVGRDGVTGATLLVAAAGYGLLAVRPPLALVVASTVLIGVGMGWGPPVQARVMDHLGEDDRGTGFGLVRTCYIGFAALNGVVVGAVVTVFGWGAGITVLVGSLLAPVGILVVCHGTGRAV